MYEVWLKRCTAVRINFCLRKSVFPGKKKKKDIEKESTLTKIKTVKALSQSREVYGRRLL